MTTSTRLCAVITALLLSGLAMAQESPSLASRLAAAKIAETKGRFAEAEQELRAALAAANEGERAEVARTFAALLMRQGRREEAAALTGAPAQEPAKGEDPIQRLIAVLDSGAATNDAVRDAKTQLTTLGSLVVPHLIAAFPRLGPFGIDNALSLLAEFDDPRITALLQQQIDNADQTVVAAIAVRLRTMRRAVALPLANRLVPADRGPTVTWEVLRALLLHDPSSAATQQLARQLAEDPTGAAQPLLLTVLDDCQQPWVVDVLAVLMEHGTSESRLNATQLWLLRKKDLDEDRVLALLAPMPAGIAGRLAADAGEQHPSWVRTGLLALRGAVDEGRADDFAGSSFFAEVEWWRLSEQSAKALLALPCRSQNGARNIIYRLQDLTAKGWRATPDLDERFAELVVLAGGDSWNSFVAALPVDAEDRAMAVGAGLTNRFGFAKAVVELERPWHRLVATHLAMATKSDEVDSNLLQRDWRGAPPEAIAALVELAARWPESPSGGQLQWHPPLVNAFRRHPNLPIAVILPLVVAGYDGAWQALVARDHQAALEYARGAAKLHAPLVSALAYLLSRHGGRADVPLALRVFSLFEERAPQDLSPLTSFFAEHAGGHLEVIRLACVPVPRGFTNQSRVDIATKAANGAKVQDLGALLALMPTLQASCGAALGDALEPQVRAEHAAVLIATAEALLAKPVAAVEEEPFKQPLGSSGSLYFVVGMLGRVGGPAALPVLQRACALENTVLPFRTNESFSQRAAEAALKVAGEGRRELLGQMLTSSNLAIARVALVVPELRTDVELRAAGRAAVLRLGERIEEVAPVFAALDEPGRSELAAAVLADERIAKFSTRLVVAAVDVLGSRKDAALVPQIVRAVTHPVSGVRCRVAAALGNTFSREAAPHLLEMLKDSEDSVRKAAQKALDEIANYLDARAKWEARLK